MKIHVVGEEVAKGQGIGRKAAKGKVVVAKTAAEAVANVNEGDILVTTSTDKDMIPAIEKSCCSSCRRRRSNKPCGCCRCINRYSCYRWCKRRNSNFKKWPRSNS